MCLMPGLLFKLTVCASIEAAAAPVFAESGCALGKSLETLVVFPFLSYLSSFET